MNSGKYVFSQLLDFVNKYDFEKFVKNIMAIIEFVI